MYEIIKILHLFSLIAWMVVLFYTPRLFVYHADAVKGGEHDNTLKIMERRLMLGIGLPALLGTWVFGLWLSFFYTGFSGQGWLHAKIAIVFLLTAYHMMLAHYRKQFFMDKNNKSSRFFRIFNEIPTILLVLILILVIYKPF